LPLLSLQGIYAFRFCPLFFFFLFFPPFLSVLFVLPPPSLLSSVFFPWLFFGRFSVRGVQKRHKTIFTKSPCRKLFPQKSTKISMAGFPRLLLVFAFSGASQRWEFKNTTKEPRIFFTSPGTFLASEELTSH
jgi:hypothetical protein